MVSAVVATSGVHIHTAQPSLSAPWCWACSAMVDFAVVLADHLLEKKEA